MIFNYKIIASVIKMDILENKRFSIIIAPFGSFIAVMMGLGSFALYREISKNPDAFHTHKHVRAVMPLVPYAGLGIAVIYFLLVLAHLGYYCFCSAYVSTPDSRSNSSVDSETSSSLFKNLYDRVTGFGKSSENESKLSEYTRAGSTRSLSQSSIKAAEQSIERDSLRPQSPYSVQPSVYQSFDSAPKMSIHPPATIGQGPEVIPNVHSPAPQRTERTIVQGSYPMQGTGQIMTQDTHQPQGTEQTMIQGTFPGKGTETSTIQGVNPMQQQTISIMSPASSMPKLPDLYNYSLASTENTFDTPEVKTSYYLPYNTRFSDRPRQQGHQPTHQIAPQSVIGQSTEPMMPQRFATMQNQDMPMMQGQSVPMMQSQRVPMMQGQSMPVVQGQSMPMMQGQSMPMVQGQSMPMMQGRAMQKGKGKTVQKRAIRSQDGRQTSELLPSDIIQSKGDRFVSPVSPGVESQLFLSRQGMSSAGKAPITYTDEAYDNASVAAIDKRSSTFGYWKAKAENDEKLEIYELQTHGNYMNAP